MINQVFELFLTDHIILHTFTYYTLHGRAVSSFKNPGGANSKFPIFKILCCKIQKTAPTLPKQLRPYRHFFTNVQQINYQTSKKFNNSTYQTKNQYLHAIEYKYVLYLSVGILSRKHSERIQKPSVCPSRNLKKFLELKASAIIK